MKPKYLLILFILSISFFISCTNNNPTDSSSSLLLPTKTGTYWIYENFMLDSNGNRMTGSPTYDSTIVAGTITVHDTLGNIFINYTIDSSGTGKGDSVYYHTDKLKIYVFTNYFNNLMGNLPFTLNLPIPQKWVKLVDAEDNDWLVIVQDLPETEIYTGIKMNGTITILGSNAGYETINAENKSFNARKFILKMTFVGNVTLFSTTVPLNLVRKTNLYFADNIGLIKSVMEPMKINLLQLPGMNFPGQEQTLVRHFIAN